MNCFAYYRLPYANQYTLVESDCQPLILDSMESVGDRRGFVIVPFAEGAGHPAVLISPERVTVCQYSPSCTEMAEMHSEGRNVSEAYQKVFSLFHEAVCNGRFKKLVLTRKDTLDIVVKDYKALFERACSLYPRLMIMLFHTPQTGTWIAASPEILVDGTNGQLHSIALAGTMPYKEGYPQWTRKNMAEQQVVERYIEDIITPLCVQVTKDGPVTMRAGNLAHLRTDFHFSLDSRYTLGQLISRLHPTPAVCGMPKADALDFIARNEGMDRSYYSGFAGPVDVNDETHLYVLLRCASIGDGVTLYAGGGIMPESAVESEWLETEKKMETIGNVLR